MKKYILHIITLVLLTFFYGCSKEELQVSFTSNGGSRTLTLTLTHAGMESRATFPGNKDLNENLINRVDLFLYPAGGTESNAVFSTEGITSFKTTEDGEVTIELEVPMEEFEDLFPKTNGTQATTCEAYVIVNRPTASSIPSSTKMDDLKAISITSGINTSEKQSEFVMDGYSDKITLSNDAIAGSIAAERSAAKITLTITNIENVEEDGVTWTPIPSGMQVMFYNGVKTSQVNTASVPADDVYFSLGPDKGRGFTVSKVEVEVNGVMETQTHYNHAIPFYSYPSDWGKQTPDKEAHMVLMLPWKKGATGQTNFYYEVPIDDINKKLVRNTYYQIKLVVGVLGSTELNDEIVKLTPTCILLNWGEGQINADLDQPRYLVAEDVIKIYNQNSVNIPFESSHDVTITSKSCFKPNLNPKSGESDETPEEVTDDNLSVSGRTISYNRTLDNNFTSGTFDFTPYYTTFTITQTGNTGKELSKEITIIQYPAIFGEKEVNSDYKNNSSHHGFTFVNGYYGSGTGRDGQDYFDNVIGAPSSSVSSNAMLVFTVTTTEGTNYVIGDPRETSYTFDEDDAVWKKANAIYNGNPNRELKYYYGTETAHTALKNASESTRTQTAIYPNDAAAAAAERTYNMIAPKFRISSGYGAIDTDGERQYYDLMKKRCASYQEDGYPAGRWRLPTKAELEFIFYLSNTGKVPQLFVSYMDYWCAHGAGKPDIDNKTVDMLYRTYFNDKGDVSVRCVYDDWYWGSEPVLKTEDEKKIFTWGDIPRGQ